MTEPFVHLHVHSEFSLLDGALRLGDLVETVAQRGSGAVAVTDHGNLHGAVAFYSAATAAGIKPILGYEAYVAPGRRQDRETTGGPQNAGHHFVLLAENETGYRNLIRLATTAALDGFYYKPRIDKEVLAAHAEGLLGLTACLKGEVAQRLLREDPAGAAEVLGTYRDILGRDNVYLEIQDHAIDDERRIRGALIQLAADAGVPLVATNDCHYLRADDWRAHDALLCINTGKLVTDENRMKYKEAEFHLRTYDEMRARFGDVPEALANTLRVAERCHVELRLDERHAPVYPVEPGDTPEAMLRRLCDEGLTRRYGTVTDAHRDRLRHELEIIEAKGFSSYFLIVWDFVRYATERGIPCGARGSGVGCMVAYLLGLSTVDPLAYGLLFERFMDPSRNEMPDLDIDICQDGRQELLRYVREKYGQENVAQIITFGTMAARAVVRDVGRVLDLPLPEVDAIAKRIPAVLKMTLDKALDQEPELKRQYDENARVREMIDIARRLEGLARHASVHAAGVVIADRPLVHYIPLCRVKEDITTQWPMDICDEVGLLKMDFLGLRTLSTLQRAVDLVRERHGVELDLDDLPLDDAAVFGLFQRGETRGIFQFESAGFRDLLQKMKPSRLDHLIAANALYRPGAMTMIDDFIARMHNRAAWSAPHPVMDEVLDETYGIMAYQEQVMRIVNRLGHIPLERAYKLIKAISKKKMDVINAEHDAFLDGCKANRLERSTTDAIWENITAFGGYGFNKSHSARYAQIAYQTAYLKVHYPLEFMAALLTYEMGSSDKLAEYMDECRRMGIDVAPPDVNESGADFTVAGDRIRFGLAAVKGVGGRAVEAILAARDEVGPFESLFHFCEHVDLAAVNKTVVESLIKCGAFDSTGARRSQLALVMDRALAAGAGLQDDRRKGQMTMFEAFAEDEPADAEEPLPDVPEWPEDDRLKREKDALGLYVSGHPLARHETAIRHFATASAAELGEVDDGAEVVVGGLIKSVRVIVTKTGKYAGQKMAIFDLEDLAGTVSCVVFAPDYQEVQDLVQADQVVFVRGTVDRGREEPQIRTTGVLSLDEGKAQLTTAVLIRLEQAEVGEDRLHRLRDVLAAHPGRVPVYLRLVATDGGETLVQAADRLSVAVTPSLREKVAEVLGADHFLLAANGHGAAARV